MFELIFEGKGRRGRGIRLVGLHVFHFGAKVEENRGIGKVFDWFLLEYLRCCLVLQRV